MRLRPALPAVPALLAMALALPAPRAAAQANVLLPADSVERLLGIIPFELRARADTRFEGDRTQRVVLAYADGSTLGAKWAKSAPRGEEFNNVPRYEVAAYALQKLFLDEPDYVVPPTVARGVPLDVYRVYEPNVAPTFSGTSSVLVVLQYWLFNVTALDHVDRARLERDTSYARHFGNLNVLTYLIRQADANSGNVLISRDSLQPRMFSVDNGVAFASLESDRGNDWKFLRTDRLPRTTVERLRALDREDLERALAVVAQFEIRDGQLVPVPPTTNLDPGHGVRRKGNLLQLGLTRREIDAVDSRRRSLLRRVDEGKVEVF
jgi:hypothetical protein